MADTPVDILKRYWGHSTFRPMQSEIIGSVLSGADTLGLLPTGGGKSVTFQVPALMLPGLTLVITPLISLMKDQVDNLRAADIQAACLHSGMSRGEQRLALQKAALGRVKLLYLSPEKLCSPRFADELRDLDVSLIVVDEAHCISQWGYDFRPSYLRIAQLRERFPAAPVLALTASATPEVIEDICAQLRFRNRNAIFRRSFARPNISYVVRHGDNKPERLLRVLRTVAGSGIVYVRSRRRTCELAEELRAQGISAEFYHAGLAAEEKTRRQQQWKDGMTRVMVATNAFGMGIDKPDVRVVVHYDLPSSVEEYYQEAGRAGRDGRPSFAVALVSQRDKATLRRRIDDSFPPKEFIAEIYDRASVFVDLSIGEGDGKVFDFNFDAFCHHHSLRPAPVRAALGILTRAGYVEFDEDTDARARVMIVARKEEIYGLRLSDDEDEVLQHLLRNCPGIFADFVQITEAVIASDLRLTTDTVYHALLGLARTRALIYVPRRQTPYLYYPSRRILSRYLEFRPAIYEHMRRRMEQRTEAMLNFAFDSDRCRAQTILRYFGENDVPPCGCCDVCRDRRTSSPATDQTMPSMTERILHVLSRHPEGITPEALLGELGANSAAVAPVLRDLLDDGTLTTAPDSSIILNQSPSHP